MTGASVTASSEDSIAGASVDRLSVAGSSVVGASAVIGSDSSAARVDFTLCFAVSIFSLHFQLIYYQALLYVYAISLQKVHH